MSERTPHPPMDHHDLMEIFNELSFRQRFHKVVNGLRQPKESGEYKYARLAMLRLWSPALAIGVPVLTVVLLVFLKAGQMPERAPVEVMMMDPEAPEKLEKIEEMLAQEPLKPPEPIDLEFAPNVSMTDKVMPGPVEQFSPAPSTMDTVAMVKSPVVMKGIYGSRSPGARGKAIETYGGGIAAGVVEGAVLRALRWLKKIQNADGSWTGECGGPPKDPPKGGESGTYGIKGAAHAYTGLALLCFLAHGETPDSEEFGPTVEKALRWLLSHQRADGKFVIDNDLGYGHMMATYALCEAFALTKVPEIRVAADKAVNLIIKGQHATGGWNYDLRIDNRDDTSVGAWACQALKAAKMAGITSPELDGALKRAVGGFVQNFVATLDAFGYDNSNTGYNQLTSAAVLSLQLLGQSRKSECRKGIAWLQANATCDWDKPWGRCPLYYWYYTTQAMFHEGGDAWSQWNRKFALQLVKRQNVLKGAGVDQNGATVDLGYWDYCNPDEYATVPIYNTVMCTLQLEVYYRYLPTYKQPADADEAPVAIEDPTGVEINGL